MWAVGQSMNGMIGMKFEEEEINVNNWDTKNKYTDIVTTKSSL